jgi:hypothetical protein
MFFPLRRKQKPINFRPYPVIGPSKLPSMKMNIYQTLPMNELRKVFYSRRKTTCSRPLTGNRTTLKSPLKHHGLSHQLINPTISFHNTLLLPSSLGPYTPPNAYKKLSSALRNETTKVYRPTYSSTFSTALLSHIIRIPPDTLLVPI